MKHLIITAILALLGCALGFVPTAGATQLSSVQSVREEAGTFTVDSQDHYRLLIDTAGTGCNCDITNNGEGWIYIYVWNPVTHVLSWDTLGPNESRAYGVVTGGSLGVGLESGASASGTYTIS